MDKTKLAILVGLLLALFFFVKVDAEASETYFPHYYGQEITSHGLPYISQNYKFNIGADGIHVDGTNSFITYASGTASFSFDTGAVYSTSLTVDEVSMYDFINFRYTPVVSTSLNYTDNGFDVFNRTVFSVRPYVILQGEKHYMANEVLNSFVIEPSDHIIPVIFGAEIDVIVSFDGTSVSEDIIKTFFGSADVNVTFVSQAFTLGGTRYVSSGDDYVVRNLESMFVYLRDNMTTMFDNLKTGLVSTMTEWRNALSSQMRSWQLSLDDKLDEVIETLTKSFDSSKAEDTNSALSGSLDSWEAAEGQTMSNAKIEVGSYDTSSAFSFTPALVSSLSLVTAFSTGFLNASGDFITAITVMFSLVFVSVLVGLVRFVRR